MSTPTQRPGGELIERLRTEVRPALSGRAATKAAGMSPSRWTQIMRGYKQETPELRVPVHAPATTLARMARAVGASPDQLREVGREDAATDLEDLMTVHEHNGYTRAGGSTSGGMQSGYHRLGTGGRSADLCGQSPRSEPGTSRWRSNNPAITSGSARGSQPIRPVRPRGSHA